MALPPRRLARYMASSARGIQWRLVLGHGQSDAGGHRRWRCCRDRGADAFAHHRGGVGGHLINDQEFLSAQPGHHRARTHGGADAVGSAHQHLATDALPMDIVDGLEGIQVDGDAAQAHRRPRGRQAPAMVFESSAIGHIGQRAHQRVDSAGGDQPVAELQAGSRPRRPARSAPWRTPSPTPKPPLRRPSRRSVRGSSRRTTKRSRQGLWGRGRR